jgi:osmotically-inducible protein OsmY
MRSRVLLLVCVGLVACSRADPKSAEPVPVGETSITAAAFEWKSSDPTFLESDPALTHSIERAIAAEPELTVAARNVGVTVERGVVTLRGTVEEHATRDKLAAVVRRMPGVNWIENDVVANPVRNRNDRESDEKIAFSLQRTLHSDPAVRDDADTVTIEVVHGSVTLRGAVSDASTSASLERLVMETPGAASVSNQLRVRGD